MREYVDARPAAGWSSCAGASTTRAPRRAAGATAAPGRGSTADVSPDALAAAQAFLGRPGVEIAPKKMWPTGLDAVGVPLQGKIAADEQALPGRAVGRLSDLGWGGRLRALLGPDTPDVAVPDDVAGAVVEVLKAWAHGDDPWPARPVAVVAVGSRRRPAAGRARWPSGSPTVGRLPLLGEVLPTAGAPPRAAGRAATAPSGSARCTTPSPCRPTSPRRSPPSTARCCWSTTWSTPAGR